LADEVPLREHLTALIGEVDRRHTQAATELRNILATQDKNQQQAIQAALAAVEKSAAATSASLEQAVLKAEAATGCGPRRGGGAQEAGRLDGPVVFAALGRVLRDVAGATAVQDNVAVPGEQFKFFEVLRLIAAAGVVGVGKDNFIGRWQ
jgi:hypothetical protein